MKAAVVVFPGSNCDRDLAVALEKAGADVTMVWHKDTSLPTGLDFVGVPAPALACLGLSPLFLVMAGVDVAGHYVEAAITFVVVCAGLAVGTFPTMSLKGTTFPASMRLPVILLAVAFVISLFVFPWYTLLFANVIYLMMIPIFSLSKRAKKAAKRS